MGENDEFLRIAFVTGPTLGQHPTDLGFAPQKPQIFKRRKIRERGFRLTDQTTELEIPWRKKA